MMIMSCNNYIIRKCIPYSEFGESSAIRQTKTIQIGITINNLLADLLIRQTLFHQMFETSQFAKLSRYTVPLLP